MPSATKRGDLQLSRPLDTEFHVRLTIRGTGPTVGLVKLVLRRVVSAEALAGAEIPGGGGRWKLYLTLHCHHQNESCIKMSSDEIHFKVSLTVRDKVTKQCPQTTTFEERGEPK